MRIVSRRLGAVLLGLTLAALLGEVGLRVAYPADENGDVYVDGRRLLPFHLPLASTRRLVERSEGGAIGSFVYDPDCGWSPVPGSENDSHGGWYDAAGIRTAAREEQYALEPAPGTLRIALFGDSYTHGDEVATEDSWGRVLERELNAAGVRAEVLNFGVGGYGMDQAFQRWRKLGAAYHPQLVLLGFQAENVQRNLNLIRPLKSGGADGLCFTKPRFVLVENRLELLNHPALPPAELPTLLSNLQAWPLLEHELFYDPEEYRPRWWSALRLTTLAANGPLAGRGALAPKDGARSEAARFFSLSGEGAQVTRRLMIAFEREVEQTGARFALVHLPKRVDLEQLRRRGKTVYQALLDKLAERHRFIDPSRPLITALEEGADDLYAPQRHYAPRACAILGAELARALVAEGLVPQPGR